MKYYVKSNFVRQIEGMDYELLVGVDSNLAGRGVMKINQWGNGWIFEADEYFRTYCVLMHGFGPAVITDEEYKLLTLCKVVYFSKERTAQIRKSIMAAAETVK
jgi:hypothetical protein